MRSPFNRARLSLVACAGLMFQPARTGLVAGYCAEHLIIFHLLHNVNCSCSACKWRWTKNGQQRGRKVTWNEGVRWLGRRWLMVVGPATTVFCFKQQRERPESERSWFFPFFFFLPYFLLYFPFFIISLFLYQKNPSIFLFQSLLSLSKTVGFSLSVSFLLFFSFLFRFPLCCCWWQLLLATLLVTRQNDGGCCKGLLLLPLATSAPLLCLSCSSLFNLWRWRCCRWWLGGIVEALMKVQQWFFFSSASLLLLPLFYVFFSVSSSISHGAGTVTNDGEDGGSCCWRRCFQRRRKRDRRTAWTVVDISSSSLRFFPCALFSSVSVFQCFFFFSLLSASLSVTTLLSFSKILPPLFWFPPLWFL